MKERVRDLYAETKPLAGRLTAARDNVRFADKRISDLEAQLDQQPPDSL